ncbi:MAG TPA: energy transducer TonB [Terriglobales bacterium]|nr:energy transducer TonB [Terriglobales bacterium]
MFEASLVECGRGRSGGRPRAVIVSAGAQAALILAAVAWPLGQVAGLPTLLTHTRLEIPLAQAAPAATRGASFAATRLVAWSPRQRPQAPAPLPALAAPERAFAPAVLALPGTEGAPPTLLAGMGPRVAPPAPVAPAAPAAPILVGGELQAARCLACPPPPYPDFARHLRLQGTVELRALIASDGRVEEVLRLRGNALLAATAERAVQGWRYRPLRLNGQPVAVETIITVHFRLGGG